MIKRESNNPESSRTLLNFVNTAKGAFAFLADLGFSQVESSPTIVRYRRGDLEANVYHGRQSYELDFEIVRNRLRYSLAMLIRAVDSEAGRRYRNYTATTEGGLAEGLARLARLVKRYGESALQGDPKVYEALENQRRSWSEKYSLDVLEDQVRPRAVEAFRLGNYKEAAELFEQIQARLTPAELKKLAFARRNAIER